MGIIIALLKKLAISFIFDYVWAKIIEWLADEVQKTDNKYDDDLVAFFDGKKDEVRSAIKQAAK